MSVNVWKLNGFQAAFYCTLKDAFTENEIEDIKNLALDFKEEKATIFSGEKEVLEKTRKTVVKWLGINEKTEWLYRKITDIVIEANEKFFKYDLEEFEQIQYTIYNEGAFYTSHIDMVPGGSCRKLSLVMQLSDPEEYTGGDLILKFGSNDFVVEKGKGNIIIFPSYTLHEVTKVHGGNRITIVVWVAGKPFR